MTTQINAVRMDSVPSLKEPLLIVAFRGWNDGSQASTNAVRRMIDHFEAKKFASLDPEEFYVFSENRPKVELVDGKSRRRIKWQKNDFYYAKTPGAGRDLVFFLGTEPNLKWRTYCENFATVTEQVGVKLGVTLGAFLADVLYTLPVQINGFSSDLKLVDDHGLERTNYEGPTGVVGVLNDALQEKGMVTVSLWAAVPYYISIPNPKATFALLNKLCSIFDFQMELKELEKDADNFDNEINDVVANDPGVAAYVRELKKRDFLN